MNDAKKSKTEEANELTIQAWDAATDILGRVESGHFDKKHFGGEATRRMVESMSYLGAVLAMVAPDVLQEDTEEMKALYGAMLDARERSIREMIDKDGENFERRGRSR